MIDILFILKVPPPVHGSTIMNKVVADSRDIPQKGKAIKHLQSISKDVDDIGKISLDKFKKIAKNYLRMIYDVLYHNPKVIYFAISPKGKAFYKDFLGILLFKLLGKRIIYHFHVKGLNEETQSSFLKKWLYNISFKNEYAIILSDALKPDYEGMGFKEIFILPNGISQSSLSEKNEYKRKRGFIITYLSNFIKEKGVFEFIDTMALLKNKGNLFKINIIGKSADVSLEEVKQALRINNLESLVNYLGPAYGEDKFRLLKESSLFIFPTFYKSECYPLVLLEAMQFKLPIITTNEGAISNIVREGKNGYIIDPEDTEKMAVKAENLMNNNELYNSMSEASYKYFRKNNTIYKFEKNLNFIIDRVLNSYES